jgi:serine/threonine-protein kinase RsbW
MPWPASIVQIRPKPAVDMPPTGQDASDEQRPGARNQHDLRADRGTATIVTPLRRTDIPPDPRRLSDARKTLEEWAVAAGITSAVVEDIVLAAYEAMANAAEHAYRLRPGTLDLLATCEQGEIVVVVRDRGDWRPPPADPGDRGRGLLMIRSTSEAVIESGPDGTTVRMRWPRDHGR